MSANQLHYVYILQCTDGSLYTGYTNNIGKRVAAHQQGKAAKYTRGRAPVALVYQKDFATKSEAMSAEYQIKQMNRPEKLRLIERGSKRYVETIQLPIQ